MNKRALISVYAKTNLIDFAKGLVELGWEIISTGGTANLLLQEKIPVTKVSDITGFPEILGGRVKTLHPRIHGGILARRDKISDLEELKGQNIKPVDLVVVNLYPFKETVQTEGASHEDIIENIDIGGPALIRAAAKNYPHVGVIVNPAHYDLVLNELRSKGSLSLTTREKLAREAFLHTAHYDALISSYFSSRMTDGSELFQKEMLLPLQKVQDLRYGENPQQKAAFYKDSYSPCPGLPQIKQLHGKELSFNNLNDLQAAWELSREFTETTVVAVKHTNPCGVASGKTIFDAYVKAYEADPVSIFGGIIVCNREIDELTAEKMSETFLEIVAAPSFSTAATEILKKKKNLRLLLLPAVGKKCTAGLDWKRVEGGFLVQEKDYEDVSLSWEVVTERRPTQEEEDDLRFALKVVKHVKSNAIVLAKGKQTVGIGAGQMSRVAAVRLAVNQAGDNSKGSVLASDAFFPFKDAVEIAVRNGVTAIVHPGGSLRDDDSIAVCNQYQVSMVITGRRFFKH